MNLKTFRLNDIELVDEIKAGNKKAEETLYRKYQQKLTRYLRYKRYNSFDLEDCVSEILIKVFEKIEKYDNTKSSFSTWVGTITNNHVINKNKQKINNVTLLSYSSNGNVGDSEYSDNIFNIIMDEPTPEQIIQTSDFDIDNSHNMTVISTVVSNQDFNMLKMKYVDGYTYNEIGEHFSMTSNTVSNRVNYIKTVISKNKDYFEK